jgi:hypothetical protein
LYHVNHAYLEREKKNKSFSSSKHVVVVVVVVVAWVYKEMILSYIGLGWVILLLELI